MTAAEAGSAPIRVVLIDRHPVSLRGLAREIETGPGGLEVVGAVGDVAEGILLVQESRPAVAVYGAGDDDADPVGTTRALLGAAPEVAIVVFGGPEALGRAAVTAGAAGFVAKSSPVPLVLGAIAAAARGDAVEGRRRERTRGAGEPGPARPGADPPRLTVREWEVLHLLAQGADAARIGEALFISRNTARNYVQSLLTKLGAHSKLEAVAIARRSGMLGG